MEDESTQNESMKDKPEKIEKNDKKEDNSKNNSDERINNKKIKQKDNSQSLEERQSQAYKKKLKSRFSPNKRKRINMYLVLTIFCSLLLACLVISHFYFENGAELKLLIFFCLKNDFLSKLYDLNNLT